MGLRKLHICPNVTKMGSIIGRKIDYNGVGAPRGQRHIPSKSYPKYPPPPPGQFRSEISEIPRAQWNGTFRLQSDPSHRAFGYCPCKQDTKERYCQMERDISVRPTEMTRPVKVDHLHLAGPEYSGRTKPKWSVPLDAPTEILV